MTEWEVEATLPKGWNSSRSVRGLYKDRTTPRLLEVAFRCVPVAGHHHHHHWALGPVRAMLQSTSPDYNRPRHLALAVGSF
jgi:hypothetical protein